MKTTMIEILKLWLVAGIAVLALLVLMGSMDDLNDRLVDETVRDETISQQKHEQLAHQEELRKLSIRAEYMTGFKSK